MISLVGLLIGALLIATGNLLDNDVMFLAGSALILICGLTYFKKG